jgi:glycosyltransferase involved in cell wall biosynthesis
VSACNGSGGSELVRLERLEPAGGCRRRVLFVTNMWPDEKRPYYGSFIHSQARSLAAGETLVDVIYVRGFLGNRAYLRSLREIPRLGRGDAYDLVHVHYGHTAVASLGLRQRPLVVSFCGEDLLGAPREDGITTKSRIEVAVFRQVARLATVTITKSAEMEAVLPRPVRARNHVLPNGVDLEMFVPRPREQAREELGWEREGKVMLFLGNPEDPRKNLALAEAAAAKVEARVPGARLHKAWGVEPEQVPVLMSAADCLLFPSKSEGSPNAVKEAMACALPIVAAPVGDIAERLEGVADCYVRPHDPDAFAAAAEQALGADRAPAAREAVESLGIARVAGRLGEIYDEALARHCGGR